MTHLDIVIPQNGTFKVTVQVVGGPASMTGYTGEMKIRKSKANPVVLADVPGGNFTVDATARTLTMQIPSAATALYDWTGTAVYDMYLVSPSGTERWRVAEGIARLSHTVTR